MKTRISRLILLAGLLTLVARPGFLAAQSTPAKALLALAKRDRTLAIVDPSSLKVLAKVPVGPDPHEVIADADGKFAYVSNYGGGAYHTLAVVDLVAQKALPPVDLGALYGPHGLAFVGDKVWFTAEGAKVIGSYDPATHHIDWVCGTGQNRTHMIYVARDLRWIITANVASGTMSFIEKSGPGAGVFPSGSALAPPAPPPGAPPGPPPGPPAGNWNQTLITVGRGPEGFDVSPDGKEVWVANAQDGTVSIIDIATRKVTETLAADVVGANRLKFTPDGKLVFVSSLRAPDVAIFDAASHSVAKRLKVGTGAAGILMDPDGSRAFVACSPDNYIVAVDLKTLEVTGRLEVGQDPDGLAWAIRR